MLELLATALRDLIVAVNNNGNLAQAAAEAGRALAAYEDAAPLTLEWAERIGFARTGGVTGTWWDTIILDARDGKMAVLELRRDLSKLLLSWELPGQSGQTPLPVPATLGQLRRLVDALRSLRGDS